MAGTAMPAIKVMPTGAPIKVPSCQRIFFLRLHGFFPQNVQPDGLRKHTQENYFHAEGLQNDNVAGSNRWDLIPEVVQVWNLLHTEPAKLTAAHSAGHVITAAVVHLDDVGTASGTGLDVIGWDKIRGFGFRLCMGRQRYLLEIVCWGSSSRMSGGNRKLDPLAYIDFHCMNMKPQKKSYTGF